MVSVFDGQLTRTWFYEIDNKCHVINLYHDTITGVRSATIDYQELKGSLGNSSVLMESVGHRIFFTLSDRPGYIEIKRSGWVGFSYWCMINNQPIKESTEGVAENQDPAYKIKITDTTFTVDNTSEDSTQTVAWYVVKSIRLKDAVRTTVHRRFREFAELNSQVKQNLKGHHMRDILPPLPEKPLKMLTDHRDPAFIEERCRKLEVFILSLVAVPHVSKMVCVKAFLGIMDQVREYSVSFHVPTLGISLIPYEKVNSILDTNPAIVGAIQKPDICKGVSSGDSISNINGIPISGTAFNYVVSRIKSLPRPIILHFVQVISERNLLLDPTTVAVAPNTNNNNNTNSSPEGNEVPEGTTCTEDQICEGIAGGEVFVVDAAEVIENDDNTTISNSVAPQSIVDQSDTYMNNNNAIVSIIENHNLRPVEFVDVDIAYDDNDVKKTSNSNTTAKNNTPNSSIKPVVYNPTSSSSNARSRHNASIWEEPVVVLAVTPSTNKNATTTTTTPSATTNANKTPVNSTPAEIESTPELTSDAVLLARNVNSDLEVESNTPSTTTESVTLVNVESRDINNDNHRIVQQPELVAVSDSIEIAEQYYPATSSVAVIDNTATYITIANSTEEQQTSELLINEGIKVTPTVIISSSHTVSAASPLAAEVVVIPVTATTSATTTTPVTTSATATTTSVAATVSSPIKATTSIKAHAVPVSLTSTPFGIINATTTTNNNNSTIVVPDSSTIKTTTPVNTNQSKDTNNTNVNTKTVIAITPTVAATSKASYTPTNPIGWD